VGLATGSLAWAVWRLTTLAKPLRVLVPLALVTAALVFLAYQVRGGVEGAGNMQS
jgi:hypothetical protein